MQQNHPTFSFCSGQDFPVQAFSKRLNEMLEAYKKPAGPQATPVFLCIGTDRSTGDSLGPLIGHMLKQQDKLKSRCTVYGTLHTPVHALNLQETLTQLNTFHGNSPIICVDASLGAPERVGSITLSHRPLRPGLGVNKTLPSIGNISITGIIGTVSMSDPLQLQSIRLSMIMEMATDIAQGISSCMLKESPYEAAMLAYSRTAVPVYIAE